MKTKNKFKFTLSLIVLLVIAFGLVGCTNNDYEDYLKNIEKTQDIVKGRQEMNISVSLDFDTTELDDSQVKKINKFKELTYKGMLKFDTQKDAFENSIYLKIGSVGFDSKVYGDNDNMLIELLNIGKFIKVEDLEQNTGYENIEFSQDTTMKIDEVWKSYIKSENVFKGENILIETPSGVVKSKKYSIVLEGEAINFVNEVVDIVIEDKSIASLFTISAIESDKSETFDTEKIEVESFEIESFVDIDGYIVKDTIRFKMNYDDKYFKGIDFQLDSLLFDIEKEQDISFPKVSPEEIINVDNFSEEAPTLYNMIN